MLCQDLVVADMEADLAEAATEVAASAVDMAVVSAVDAAVVSAVDAAADFTVTSAGIADRMDREDRVVAGAFSSRLWAAAAWVRC